MSSASELLATPISSVVILVCSLIWFRLWNARIEPPVISSQYDKVVSGGEWWRLVTACFSHTNIMHLAMNMMSSWNLRPVELYYGSKVFAQWIFVLMCASELTALGINHVLIHRFGKEHYRRVYCLGFSGVVFGIMTMATRLSQAKTYSFFGFWQIPMPLAPWAFLLVTQAIIPRASFVGHLAGLLVGYLISFGAFAWMDDYLFVSGVAWLLVAMLKSLKTTTEFPLPFITLLQERHHAPVGRIVGGVLVHDDDDDDDDGDAQDDPVDNAGPEGWVNV